MPKDSTAEAVSTGVCSFCKGEFEKKAMLQHLKSCEQRKAQIEAEETGKARKPKKTSLFHILVEGTYLIGVNLSQKYLNKSQQERRRILWW